MSGGNVEAIPGKIEGDFPGTKKYPRDLIREGKRTLGSLSGNKKRTLKSTLGILLGNTKIPEGAY